MGVISPSAHGYSRTDKLSKLERIIADRTLCLPYQNINRSIPADNSRGLRGTGGLLTETTTRYFTCWPVRGDTMYMYTGTCNSDQVDMHAS